MGPIQTLARSPARSSASRPGELSVGAGDIVVVVKCVVEDKPLWASVAVVHDAPGQQRRRRQGSVCDTATTATTGAAGAANSSACKGTITSTSATTSSNNNNNESPSSQYLAIGLVPRSFLGYYHKDRQEDW